MIDKFQNELDKKIVNEKGKSHIEEHLKLDLELENVKATVNRFNLLMVKYNEQRSIDLKKVIKTVEQLTKTKSKSWDIEDENENVTD